MQDETSKPDDYDVTLASTEVTPTFPGLPELPDDVKSSKIAESINRATCVVICTDRTELRRFLRCASLHYDLGAKGVLEAYRVGKWDALVLRQATGDGSWASLGLSVKPGCRPALIGKTARGVPLSAPPARLFSEKDLVDLRQGAPVPHSRSGKRGAGTRPRPRLRVVRHGHLPGRACRAKAAPRNHPTQRGARVPRDD